MSLYSQSKLFRCTYQISPNGVWISFLFGEIATLIFIFCAICKHYGHFPKSIDDLLMLPKDRFRVTVTNIEEVMQASADIQKFLLSQGATERNSYIMALSVEELAGNIIRRSFKSARKNTISNPKKLLELSTENKATPTKNIEYLNVYR